MSSPGTRDRRVWTIGAQPAQKLKMELLGVVEVHDSVSGVAEVLGCRMATFRIWFSCLPVVGLRRGRMG